MINVGIFMLACLSTKIACNTSMRARSSQKFVATFSTIKKRPKFRSLLVAITIIHKKNMFAEPNVIMKKVVTNFCSVFPDLYTLGANLVKRRAKTIFIANSKIC